MMPSASTPFAAFVLADGRRAGYCLDQKPRCIYGHRIPDNEAPVTEGIITCKHREGRGAPICGARIYLQRQRAATSEWLYLVVEITRAHVQRMKDAGTALAIERLSIVQCVLPGVEIDLAAGVPGLTADPE